MGIFYPTTSAHSVLWLWLHISFSWLIRGYGPTMSGSLARKTAHERIFILKIIFALINSHRFQFSLSFGLLFPITCTWCVCVCVFLVYLKCPADNKCEQYYIRCWMYGFYSAVPWKRNQAFAAPFPKFTEKVSDSRSNKSNRIKINEMFALIDYNFW